MPNAPAETHRDGPSRPTLLPANQEAPLGLGDLGVITMVSVPLPFQLGCSTNLFRLPTTKVGPARSTSSSFVARFGC